MKLHSEEAKICSLTINDLEEKSKEQKILCEISHTPAYYRGTDKAKLLSLEGLNNR